MFFKKGKNFFKRFISFLVVLCFILVNLTGCLGMVSAQTSVFSLGETNIDFEDYMLAVIEEFPTIENKTKTANKEGEFIKSDVTESMVDGKVVINYYVDQVDARVKNMLLMFYAAEKLGVTFTQEEEMNIVYQADAKLKKLNEKYNAQNIGISAESCKKFCRYEMLMKKIGQGLYGPGKEKEVKDEHIKQYLKDSKKIAKYGIISLPKFFENLKLKDCKDEKEKANEEENKEENKDKEKEKKEEKEQDEKVIEKYFKVKDVKALGDHFLDLIGKGELSFNEVEGKVCEAFKSKYRPTKEQYVYFEEKETEKNPYDFMKNKDKENEIKKNLKGMKENDCMIVKKEDEVYILKRCFISEEDLAEKEKNEENSIKNVSLKDEIKGKIEENHLYEYIDKIKKENSEAIDENKRKFSLKFRKGSVKKQIYKILENKKTAQTDMF